MPYVNNKKPGLRTGRQGSALLVALLCLGTIACGGSGIRTDVRADKEDEGILLTRQEAPLSAEELFKRGSDWYAGIFEGTWGPHYRRVKHWPLAGYARAKECEHAAPYFRAVFLKDPISQMGVMSELRLADIAFCQENFVEAISRYEGFKSAHPTNPSVVSGYCDFQIVAARFAVLPQEHWYIPTPPVHKRDPQELLEAFVTLQTFLQRYNEATVSKFINSVIPADRPEIRKDRLDGFRGWYSKAQEMADALRVRLVKYQLFVAEYHLTRGDLTAAMARLRRARQISGATSE